MCKNTFEINLFYRFVNHAHQEKYIGKQCNGIDLPEMNYDSIKRELLPMINNKEYHSKDEQFNHNNSGIQGYMTKDKRYIYQFKSEYSLLHHH